MWTVCGVPQLCFIHVLNTDAVASGYVRHAQEQAAILKVSSAPLYVLHFTAIRPSVKCMLVLGFTEQIPL